MDKFVRHRVCDPEHVLSVEEAIGNAPEFETDIRDSSHIRLRNSDMRVPAGARGESAFDSTKHASRECPWQGSCDLETPFSFRDSSFLNRVYVTSSDDPNVLPGVHRLLDLKAFPDVECNNLKNQRCGVERKLVPHGRKKPSCGVLCTLGKGIEGVGAAMLTIGTAAMSVHPNPIMSTLGDMGSDVASYLYPMPPPGKSTDVVQPVRLPTQTPPRGTLTHCPPSSVLVHRPRRALRRFPGHLRLGRGGKQGVPLTGRVLGVGKGPPRERRRQERQADRLRPCHRRRAEPSRTQGASHRKLQDEAAGLDVQCSLLCDLRERGPCLRRTSRGVHQRPRLSAEG